MSRPLVPPTLASDLGRLTARELSLPSRLRYLSLLFAATGMTIVAVSLLATEPVLPRRTIVALGAVAAIGATWTGFSVWVLTRRRPLMGQHRVIAARLAIAFCLTYTAGAAWLGVATASSAAFIAAAVGGVLSAIAVGALVRANRRLAELSRRRDELIRRPR